MGTKTGRTKISQLFTVIALTVAIGVALLPLNATASIDNKGTDFLMAYMPNTLGGAHSVEVHLASEVATTVTV